MNNDGGKRTESYLAWSLGASEHEAHLQTLTLELCPELHRAPVKK